MRATSRTVAVVTGTRAEFGLLLPVLRAIDAHPRLTLRVVVAGAHLLPPARTVREVEAAFAFAVAACVPMQQPGRTGRRADAEALGAGVTGFARAFAAIAPDLVVVLGDRIEAFAAAAAASVGGLAVAHLHGGDRAPGVADEAMRHAVTKLAHLHLPATPASARRIEAMGERRERIHVVGSPALDDLAAIPPLDEGCYTALGRPKVLMLLHPAGRPARTEAEIARRLLAACRRAGPTLALHPNHDPGREGIVEAIDASGVESRPHLARPSFVGLLRRLDLLVGNSSAGLIEAAALGVRCVDVGPRQSGRERAANVARCDEETDAAVADAFRRARGLAPDPEAHPFGDGRSGARVAALLAEVSLAPDVLRKRNTY